MGFKTNHKNGKSGSQKKQQYYTNLNKEKKTFIIYSTTTIYLCNVDVLHEKNNIIIDVHLYVKYLI